MNKMILIQSLAVFSVLFFSCDKTDNCPDSENYTNSGIIIDNASVENNCVSVKNRGNYIILINRNMIPLKLLSGMIHVMQVLIQLILMRIVY
jgi:hypothetical protein